MKNLITMRDSFKLLSIYFITTIFTMVLDSFFVKYDFIQEELKNSLWTLLLFSLLFLLLIKLFRVSFKSISIFLGIIMILSILPILNIEFFASVGTTPSEMIFPSLTMLCSLLILPFGTLFSTLVGYSFTQFAYIITPIYILFLIFISYILLNCKKYKKF